MGSSRPAFASDIACGRRGTHAASVSFPRMGCASLTSSSRHRPGDGLTSSTGQCPSITSIDQSTAVIRVVTPVARQSSLTSLINSSNGGPHVHPLSTAGGIASPQPGLRYQGNPCRYRRPHRRKRGRHLRQRSELESDHRAAAALAHRPGQEQDEAPLLQVGHPPEQGSSHLQPVDHAVLEDRSTTEP